MKTTVITLRVPEVLKTKLEVLVVDNDTSLSNLIKTVLEAYVSPNDEDLKSNNIASENQIDLLQTLGFTELISWIYDKKTNPENCHDLSLYKQFVDLIKKLNDHPLFNDEILNEFNKVSIELNYCLKIGDYSLDFFEFSQNEDGYQGFDYQLLADFMYGIRYDEHNDRIINIE